MAEPQFEFFCLVESDSALAVRRVRVTEDLQKRLSKEFHRQEKEFLPKDVEVLDYEPGYTPDEEVFVLRGYSLPAHLRDIEDARDALTEVSEEEIEEGHVKALIAAALTKNPSRLLFQNFDARQVIQRTGFFLLLGDDTFRRVDNTGIVVGSKLSALRKDGALYFRSEHMVRRYLPLDPVFEAATDEEIEEFVQVPLFAPTSVSDFVEIADRWIRKKVTSIQRRGVLEKEPLPKIVKIAKGFGVQVVTQKLNGEDKIVLPKDKKPLKALLRFLDDDLLVSRLTDTRYQVNSKRPI